MKENEDITGKDIFWISTGLGLCFGLMILLIGIADYFFSC